MNLLYLTTYYHRAMIFRDMMDTMMEKNYNIKAFNAVVKEAKIKSKYEKIMDDKVIQSECFNKWDRYIYPLKQWKIYKSIINKTNLKDYDLIHSHMLFNGGLAAYLINKNYNIPYTISVRNTDENTFMKIPFFNKLSDHILKNAAGIQFLSPAYKKRFIETHIDSSLVNNIKNKSYFIPNGLEDFWFNNKGENKIYKNDSRINLLFVGKIDQNKNILTLTEVINILIEKGFTPKLTVIGQKVDEEVYNSLENDENVEIIGYVTKEELIKYYRDSDVFVMPSIHETFGRVYAEAMTQGLPVIYTKGQGFDGIFKDGYVGYSVPSKDYNYIAESIIKILNNYEEISKNCIKECHKFDWENIANDLDKFYSESLERSKI